MKKYEAYVGCEEWQDVEPFSSEKEALEWIGQNLNQGLYPATEAWIENTETKKREYVDVGN